MEGNSSGFYFMYVRVFVCCILITVVDGFYEVTGIAVFSECFLEMVEFIFLVLCGIAMSVDAVYECSDATDFVLYWLVAMVIQDLVGVDRSFCILVSR